MSVRRGKFKKYGMEVQVKTKTRLEWKVKLNTSLSRIIDA